MTHLVGFVHSFDRLDYDDLLLPKDDHNLDAKAMGEHRENHHAKWCNAAMRAIKGIEERTEADEKQVAVIDYLLRCFVATEAVATSGGQDWCPCAVFGNFGQCWQDVSITSTFPPFQLHYGEEDEAFISNDSDKTIPNIFEEAKKELREAGVEGVQLYSYPNQTLLSAHFRVARPTG